MEIRTVMASVAERLAAVSRVRAAVVVGSHASGVAEEQSDVDLFIYATDDNEDLTVARADVVKELADTSRPPTLGVPGHPNTDAWILRDTETWVDAMYWTTSWAEDELEWRLVHHAPKVGYTTAFWRSIRDGIPVFERDDWHASLQRRAKTPYPDELRHSIVRLNRNLIGSENPFSFRHQAATAAVRSDRVALQHAVGKWLASYFDVLFAANRVLHPGEKRLVEFAKRECDAVPLEFETDVNEMIRLMAASPLHIGSHADEMVVRLDVVAGVR